MGILGALRWLFTDDNQKTGDKENDSRRKCGDCRYADKTRSYGMATCVRPGAWSEREYLLDYGCDSFSSGSYVGKCKECRYNKSDEDGRYCYHNDVRITGDDETCSSGRYEYGNPS